MLVAHNAPLAIADLELPDVLGFGQVRVKVHYSGICGAQINEIDGVKGPDPYLPHLLGHEGSATVEAVGPGVTSVKPGDHVVMHWRPGRGVQSETPKYRWGQRVVNAGWVTTFNERAVVSENRVTPIGDEVDLRIAPLLGCAVTTAMGVVNNDAQLKIGQSIVIVGVGGVGSSLVQAASMVSALPIVAIDRVRSKVDQALALGATHGFVAERTAEVDAAVRQVVGAHGADVVVDTTGNVRVIEAAYALTHADGKTILVGVPRKGENVSIHTLPLHFKKVLRGSHGGGAEPHLDIPRCVRLIKAGKLPLDSLVTHEFPLDAVNEAIALVREGRAGRVVLAINPT